MRRRNLKHTEEAVEREEKKLEFSEIITMKAHYSKIKLLYKIC